MDLDRINPVALISGATYGPGALCAAPLAKGAEGGLILVDRDEAALEELADRLGEQGAAPERVSMLTCPDFNDASWWERAGGFIKDQYGRLDWAIVNAEPRMPDAGELVAWSDATAELEGAYQAMRTAMPLMRLNSQGGAIVVAAQAAALKAEPGLQQLIRAAANEGGGDGIRVNAIASGGADMKLRSFQDIARETGGDRAAFEIISNLSPPLARYEAGADIRRLFLSFLTEEAPVTGVTLVVDGGYAL